MLYFTGLPDPIIEVTLGTHKERTKSKSKTLNPVWTNEVQRIPIVNWALPNLLTLRVISKKNIGQRELGYVSQPHAKLLEIYAIIAFPTPFVT